MNICHDNLSHPDMKRKVPRQRIPFRRIGQNGAPSNAQNMNVMRPFSVICADVSLPLPVMSR